MTTATAESKSITTLSEVAKVSELKDLGWSVTGEGKEWFAHEKDGELRSLGPSASVNALYTQVKLAVGDPVAPKSLKRKGGQPTLPHTEGAVIQDLRNAILGYRATTMEILDLQKRQKEEKKTAMALMHKFEDELSVDPETGFKYFQIEMIIAELEVEMKEDLKTRKVQA